MLGLPGLSIAANRLLNVSQRLVSGNEDLEALEEAPSLGGLRAGVAEQDIRPDPDLPEALEQGRVNGKGHEPIGCLQRAKRPVPALVAALPSPLKFITRSLPFVKLSLPDLAPTLEAAHHYSSSFFIIMIIILFRLLSRGNKSC